MVSTKAMIKLVKTESSLGKSWNLIRKFKKNQGSAE